MATKEGGLSPHSKEGIKSVGRFVYDVLMFTLPKCGLPEARLPTTDFKENSYKRPNIVKIAGVSALRIALLMRDNWKRMFESRRKSLGFKDKDIATFLTGIVRCCHLSRNSKLQTMVEVILASCIELTLFFYTENEILNVTTVMGSISYIIVSVIGPEKNALATLQELFDKFDNIGAYTSWVTDFMVKFAIPYGSREDVSELFFLEVKKQHFKDIQEASKILKREDPLFKELTDRLGFLPHDLYSAIVTGEASSLPESLLASGSTLPGDRDSPEPPGLSPSSGSCKKKSRSKKSTQFDSSSRKSAPLSKAPAPISHSKPLKSQAIPEEGKRKSAKTGESQSRKDSKQGVKDSSCSTGHKLSSKALDSHASSMVPEKADESELGSRNPLEGMKDDLKRMSLDTEQASQKSCNLPSEPSDLHASSIAREDSQMTRKQSTKSRISSEETAKSGQSHQPFRRKS